MIPSLDDSLISTVFGTPFPKGLDQGDATKTGEISSRTSATQGSSGELLIHVPRSRSHNGSYGRLFPHLNPWEPDQPSKEDLISLGGETPDPAFPTKLLDYAKESFPTRGTDPTGPVDPKQPNPKIPAGYTLLGQFLAHDITFDPTTIHQRQLDPNRLTNFRTPRLDLDSVYGGGPELAPHLYDIHRPYYFLLHRGADGVVDLPRNEQGVALIADHRNDSNPLIAQMHLAILRFHNAEMNRLATRRKLTGIRAFNRAQRSTQWHFQWMIVTDWLGHLCGTLGDIGSTERFSPHLLLKQVTSSGRSTQRSGPLGIYHWSENAYLPIEFAAAVGRVGHAMITDSYILNATRNANNPIRLEELRPHSRITEATQIDWKYFADWTWAHNGEAQPSGRLELPMAGALKFIRDGRGPRNLAERDLIRGYYLGMPSGQDVERSLGIVESNSSASDPLWYQLLHTTKEGSAVSEATALILCDVMFGLLLADGNSFIRADPNWTPPGARNNYWGLRHFTSTADLGACRE